MRYILSEKIQISAEGNTLVGQVGEFESMNKEIMSREHEIIIFLNMGKDVMAKSSEADASGIKEDLGLVDRGWQEVKKNAKERQTRLSNILAKLGDFSENTRDLETGLKKAEDELGSTDNSILYATKNPRLVYRTVKGLLGEAKELEKGYAKVQKGGEDILNDANAIGADGRPIVDTVNGLGDRLENIRDSLEDKVEDLNGGWYRKLYKIDENKELIYSGLDPIHGELQEYV